MASTPAPNPQARGPGGQGSGRPPACTLRKSRGQVSGCRGCPRKRHVGLMQVGSAGQRGLVWGQACVLIPTAEPLCLRFFDIRLHQITARSSNARFSGFCENLAFQVESPVSGVEVDACL